MCVYVQDIKIQITYFFLSIRVLYSTMCHFHGLALEFSETYIFARYCILLLMSQPLLFTSFLSQKKSCMSVFNKSCQILILFAVIVTKLTKIQKHLPSTVHIAISIASIGTQLRFRFSLTYNIFRGNMYSIWKDFN